MRGCALGVVNRLLPGVEIINHAPDYHRVGIIGKLRPSLTTVISQHAVGLPVAQIKGLAGVVVVGQKIGGQIVDFVILGLLFGSAHAVRPRRICKSITPLEIVLERHVIDFAPGGFIPGELREIGDARSRNRRVGGAVIGGQVAKPQIHFDVGAAHVGQPLRAFDQQQIGGELVVGVEHLRTEAQIVVINRRISHGAGGQRCDGRQQQNNGTIKAHNNR